jgi:hypothetical protein
MCNPLPFWWRLDGGATYATTEIYRATRFV